MFGAVAAWKLHEPLGAVETHGLVPEVPERGEIASRTATEVENREGRRVLDAAE